MLWFVVGCGLLPTGGGLPTGPVSESETVFVIAASRDLGPGVVLEEDDLVALEIAPAYLPAGVFLNPEHVVGRRPHTRILAYEYVRSEQLEDPSTAFGLSGVIPVGMRVIDLPATAAPPSHLTYVDVWWTPDHGEPCAVLQAAMVVGTEAGWVQVLVSPEQALRATIASSSPSLRYAVRDERDLAVVQEVACSL